jgi:hypothetical protein
VFSDSCVSLPQTSSASIQLHISGQNPGSITIEAWGHAGSSTRVGDDGSFSTDVESQPICSDRACSYEWFHLSGSIAPGLIVVNDYSDRTSGGNSSFGYQIAIRRLQSTAQAALGSTTCPASGN